MPGVGTTAYARSTELVDDTLLRARTESDPIDPRIHDPRWRDSVARYDGRLTRYSQELLSYEMGTTLAILPVLGESYVDRTSAGVAFVGGRAVMAGAAVTGAVRLIGGRGSVTQGLGLILGGLLGYAALKWWEISDVLSAVSAHNEALITEYHIEPSDIAPGSVRYPRGHYPAAVTNQPIPRKRPSSEALSGATLPAFERAQ